MNPLMGSPLLSTSGFVAATFIDLLIVVLIALNIWRGLKVGFLRELTGLIGFAVGMFLGVLLTPLLVFTVNNRLDRTIITLAGVIGIGVFFGYSAELLGKYLTKRLSKRLGRSVNSVLGAIGSGATIIYLVWLISGMLLNSSISTLAQGLQRSFILRLASSVLPSVPSTVSHIQNIIDPNGLPQVFVGLEPWPAQPIDLASQQQIDAAVERDSNSTVRITGLGCGGIVSGSGFVVAPDIVLTNAHVVAGIKKPLVFSRGGAFFGTPVYFDSQNDIALLHVPNLKAAQLTISSVPATEKSDAVIMGYPDGGPFLAEPAAIGSFQVLKGLDIYGENQVDRSTYVFQGNVRAGDSGGPLVKPNGDVIGVVYARSSLSNDIGYALSEDVIRTAIGQLSPKLTTVGTGTCTKP